MIRLIFLGIGAGGFFSTTFILNEFMSVSGGHWLWSASLRYIFMIFLLGIILYIQGGLLRIVNVWKLFLAYLPFWIISGGIGFGAFYALLCFSADFSPGWVVAATWQFTVVASLFIFMLFGRVFPKRVWIFSLMIFFGVCLVNVSDANEFELKQILLGALPVLIASFCYPFGNQLLWEAKFGKHKFVPHITSPLLTNTFNKVMLLSLGSLPLWIVLVILIRPSLPSPSQAINTFFVALFSGIFATVIFLYARNSAKNSNELAGVDATQASEVVFALLGGILFLHNKIPSILSFLGLGFIVAGLILFVVYQKKEN
jgi:drug/metabolite transporter (DMT)-like permease